MRTLDPERLLLLNLTGVPTSSSLLELGVQSLPENLEEAVQGALRIPEASLPDPDLRSCSRSWSRNSEGDGAA